MADVSSLGEYKVVVTADYSQLQNQFKAMSELVSQTAKAMSQSLDGAINIMSSNMVSQLKTMTTSIKDAFGGMDSTIKEAGKSVEGLTKTTQEVGSSVQRSGSSARAGSEGFKAYAAQVRAAEKAEQDFRKMQGKAILAAEERDIAGRTAQHKAFWQEQVKQEQTLERQRQAEFARQQRRISQLQTQYNVAYAEINKYLQTHAKMSEAVFVRLQGKIQAISAEMQRLGAMPMVRNPLAGMNFSDYEKQFGKLDDMMKSLKHHLTWMASAAAIGVTFGIPAKTIETIAEVEKQMAQMKQVNHEVNASQEVLNKTAQEFIGIAQQYGHSVDDIIKAGVLWGRGYKDLNTVMQLTSLSAKLAVADNMNVELANRAVESVINGYQKQGEAVQFASHVVDSWTKIAHNAQSSATDLAEALMRTGAAAKAVGVDFDTTNALASAMIKATGRSGAEVGNALKSLFSSIHSDKALKQLEALGVEMYRVDEQGQKHFRSLHDVFVDLMITSHTTSRNMEKDLLAISGGKFQWSKVASVLGSYEDFIKAYGMSLNSAGFAQEQVAAQLDTINRKYEQLKATMTGIATGMGASGLSAYIKNLISSLNSFAQAMQRIPTSTYEAIGSFVKWGAIIGSSVAIIRTLVTGIYGIRAAYLIATTAQAANTAGTVANTAAKAKNYALSLLGVNAARAQATASVAAAGGMAAEAVAAEGAAVATGGFAATVTAATGGLNILLAALAAAVVAFFGYNTIASANIEAINNESQALEDNIQVKEQEIAMSEKQTEFIETLCDAHVKLTKAMEEAEEGSKQYEQAKRDLAATDEELTRIIGEDAMQQIDWNGDVGESINQLKRTHSEHTKQLKSELASLLEAQATYTQGQIDEAEARVAALEAEGRSWKTFGKIVYSILSNISSVMIGTGEAMKSLGSAIGKIAPDAGAKIVELGESAVRAGWEKRMKAGEDWTVDNAPEIASLKSEIAKLKVDKKSQELKAAQIRAGSGGIPTYANEDVNADSGVIPESGAGSAGKGGSGKSGAGAKEADNSPEAMGYRYLTSKGLDKNMVLGLLGNIMQESGFNPDADNGSHRGLIQWDYNDANRTGRWYDFMDDYLANLRGISEEQYYAMDAQQKRALQYDFAIYEMRQGKEQEAYQRILSAAPTTPEQWASLINQHYERSGEAPGSPVDWQRQKNAREYASRFERKNGEDNYTDGEKAIENAYKEAKKLFDLELERLKTERQREGQNVSAEEELKLYEKTMGVGNGKNPYAVVEAAQKDYAKLLTSVAKEEAKRADAVKSATDKQVAAIDKMADSEVAFAEKLGLMSKADVRDYYNRKNERNYATQKPLLDAKLGATVDLDKGSADDMLEAYKGLIYAKDRMEAEFYAKKVMWLSRDVDATKKALDEEMKLEEDYQTKRQELAREAYEYDARYAIGFVDSFTNAFQSGLESILNGTKSFGEALKDMFKSIVNDIIKMFAEDLAKKVKGWLSKIFHRTGDEKSLGANPDGGFFGAITSLFGGGKKKKTKATGGGGDFGSLFFDSFNLLGSFGGKKGGKGGSKVGGMFGNFSILDSLIPKNTIQQVKQQMNQIKNTMTGTLSGTYNAMSNISQTGMNSVNNAVQTGTSAMGTAWGTYKTTQVTTEETGNAAIVASSETTAATVQATTATMMTWIMAVLALFSLFGGFGGGGSSETKTTSSTNLGRSPDTYYMTPTPVMQSTTFNVPSFDIGGNIEQDMFAMVHKGEMVLTPEQADVIRSTARNGNASEGYSGNANVKSNIQVSTVDSRGFERVLKDYNRQLSKNVKRGVRNGYLTAKGLI